MILNQTVMGGGIELPELTNPGDAGDLLTGKQLIDAEGNVLTGTMPSLGAQTITPGTASKTIPAGRYLAGTQTIQGDANLAAANIKSGVSIFGVAGSYAGNDVQFVDIAGNGAYSLPVPGISKLPKLVAVYYISGTQGPSQRILSIFDTQAGKYCGGLININSAYALEVNISLTIGNSASSYDYAIYVSNNTLYLKVPSSLGPVPWSQSLTYRVVYV